VQDQLILDRTKRISPHKVDHHVDRQPQLYDRLSRIELTSKRLNYNGLRVRTKSLKHYIHLPDYLLVADLDKALAAKRDMERRVVISNVGKKEQETIDKPKGSAGNGFTLIDEMELQDKRQTYLNIQVSLYICLI